MCKDLKSSQLGKEVSAESRCLATGSHSKGERCQLSKSSSRIPFAYIRHVLSASEEYQRLPRRCAVR